MTQWLIDTFVWTAALIALVLVLRRPVAQWFGAQVTYALWALPLARFVLPPLVLPAWMAPVEPVAPLAVAEPPTILAAQLTTVQPVSPAVPWEAIGLAVWLAGAVILLVWRVRQYHEMRADLLADARPVGEAGAVRLVETPAVQAPVAFGVRDKVVALPPLFMAQGDVTARDLAIAHELAHHRGHDLLANMLAQPVLALHWFNPLAWAGWRAMRRDQEAACDARVVAGCAQDRKADYARVIAGFARGRHLALAAPMACPVLGEKSIIHRLRSLTRRDVSATRRGAGLAAIGLGALVALPLTASISYAHGDPPPPPAVPAAPLPPAAPDAPAGATQVRRLVVVRHGDEEHVTAEGMNQTEIDEALAEARHAQVEAAEAVREGHEAVREAELARAEIPRVAADCDGRQQVRRQVDDSGRSTITVICRNEIRSEARTEARSGALDGLRQAQEAIREDDALSPDQRQRVIERLQQRIDALEETQVSFAAPNPPSPPKSRPAPAAPAAPAAQMVPVVRVTFKAPVVLHDGAGNLRLGQIVLTRDVPAPALPVSAASSS